MTSITVTASDSATDTAPASTPTLPHWDMTPLFPSLESPEFENAYARVVARIGDLQVLFDALEVDGANAPKVIDTIVVTAFEQATAAFNTLLEEIRTVRAY